MRVREGLTLDRGCFARMLGGGDGGTLFMTAAEWRGAANMQGPRAGRVLAARSPAPGAGWPGRR